MSCLFCKANVKKGAGKIKRKLIFGKKSDRVLSFLDSLCLVDYIRKVSDAQPVNYDLCFVKNSWLLPEARAEAASIPPAKSHAVAAL
uniref:Uncharacterized protein n=1 Tax=Amphimedon queenslandica TaxID=400682 RepID=A0A1X7V4F6_AMPQE